MSIYPVNIKGFHKEDPHKLEVAQIIIDINSQCELCERNVTIDNCWAMHSLCYTGQSPLWCSGECAYNISYHLLSENAKMREWARVTLLEIREENEEALL